MLTTGCDDVTSMLLLLLELINDGACDEVGWKFIEMAPGGKMFFERLPISNDVSSTNYNTYTEQF